MTQTTEQERATFEAKFKVPPGVAWEFGMYFVEYAQQGSYQVERFLGKWDGWQAACRTSAAQVPEGYALISKDALRAFGVLELIEQSCCYPIATTPPPDSAKHTSCPPPADETEALEREHMGCSHCKTGIYHQEHAPLKLPEPRWHNPSPSDAAHFPYYTPQDVRQLLAARPKPLTDEQWTKIWADWFDSTQDAEDLIRSIEKAHGITQENQG